MKKMSRSIKEYKDAMDSIRISESFYKRTETLLNELPEEEIEKRPFYMSRKITAGIMAAAACIICVIGVRTVIGVRQDNIGSVSETGITEIELEVSDVSVPELIDILEEDDSLDEMLMDDEETVSSEEDEAVGQVADEPYVVEIGTGSSEISVPDNPAPASGNSSETGKTVPQEGGTAAGSAAATTVTSGNIKDQSEKDKSSSEAAHDTTAYDTIMLNDVSYEYVTVEITPYFDMEGIVSGESSVKLNGTDCWGLIEYIGELSETSYVIPNASFKSLFSLNIADENIGITFYSIYITNQNTMIITKHEPDGQRRVTYGLTGKNFDELKRALFLTFGTELDYELFENLMSGK